MDVNNLILNNYYLNNDMFSELIDYNYSSLCMLHNNYFFHE